MSWAELSWVQLNSSWVEFSFPDGSWVELSWVQLNSSWVNSASQAVAELSWRGVSWPWCNMVQRYCGRKYHNFVREAYFYFRILANAPILTPHFSKWPYFNSGLANDPILTPHFSKWPYFDSGLANGPILTPQLPELPQLPPSPSQPVLINAY